MARVARILAASRWRHFFPVAENLIVKIPFYTTKRLSNGKVSVTEAFHLDYVAEDRTSGAATVYPLPAHIVPKSEESITISFDGVVQDNQSVVLYFTNQGSPVMGNRLFTYDAASNSIVYQYVEGTGVNRAPVVGTPVVIDIINEVNTNNLYVRIPIPKKFLIQGAKPIDSNLVDPSGNGIDQFQGGYRCFLKQITKPGHGHVRLSSDRLAFEYRPDMGFKGTDAFSYRLVNAMGQESLAHRIDLDVGTNLI